MTALATSTIVDTEEEEPEARTAAGTILPSAASLAADEKFKARFWAKVTRKGKGPNDCWEWQAGKEEKGYGKFFISQNGKEITCPSHRVSFMLHHRRWPSSALMVLHSCDNPACQNPAHLREGTAQDNQDDIDARGRRNPRRRRKGAEQWRGGVASDAILRGGSKLSPETVQMIRQDAKAAGTTDPKRDGTALLLAFDLGVTEAVVANALTGKTFHWVPGAVIVPDEARP